MSGGREVGRFLPEFELYVMLAVSRLGHEAYGASIRREIEDTAGLRVAAWSGPRSFIAHSSANAMNKSTCRPRNVSLSPDVSSS